jgi:ribonuclease HI
MSFKGQTVWVRVDDAGKPLLDRSGRAEMKYRQDDPKSYRPGLANLTADPDAPPPVADAAMPSRQRAPIDQGPVPADVVSVWTDGACSGNPGPMGIGMVVIADGKRLERGEYLGIGTNNIAELTAIRRGLELARELGVAPTRPIRVHTDSGYSIGVLSLGWKAKANQELVGGIRRFLGDFPQVRLVKVAGHAGVPDNERCDELAREAVIRRGTV